MRILIISPVYPPEPVISSQTSSQIAEALADRGHNVTVVTSFPNRPSGKVYEGYKRQVWTSDPTFTNYRVYRCYSVFSPKSNLISRFLENISFGIVSGIALLFLRKADVVYGNTWPIFAQGILVLVCRLRGIPLILSIQDIYPESLFIQNRIGDRGKWLFKCLCWLDMKIHKSSAALIVISEQFKQIYVQNRGIPAEKVHLVSNWLDEKNIQVDVNDNTIRRQHAIPEDAFLVVYAGNVGVAAGVDTVIRAFQTLIDETQIYLLIAGSGSALSDCYELAAKTGNPRILFHSPWLASETSSLLVAASLFILPTHTGQSTVSAPSKLISYMFAGRPILACAEEKSEIADIVTASACGWVIPSGKPDVMAQKINLLSKYPSDKLFQYGWLGRQYALKNMSKKENLPKVIRLIEGLK